METNIPSCRLATSKHYFGLEKLIKRFNIEIMKADVHILGLIFDPFMTHRDLIFHFSYLKTPSANYEDSLHILGIGLFEILVQNH